MPFKAKLNEELFDRIYRYAQAHPLQNTAEIFHISTGTVTCIKKYKNFQAYKEYVRAKGRENYEKRMAKKQATATPKPLDTPFKKETGGTATELFGVRHNIPDEKDERIKTLEAEKAGLESEVRKLTASRKVASKDAEKYKAQATKYLEDYESVMKNREKLIEIHNQKVANYEKDNELLKKRIAEMSNGRLHTNYSFNDAEQAIRERDALKKALVENQELCDKLLTENRDLRTKRQAVVPMPKKPMSPIKTLALGMAMFFIIELLAFLTILVFKWVGL